MAKTRSMSKRAAPWSNLDHDLLFLVIMQLGIIDFVAFSGVCKSWRSVALDNWTRFMASKPPMNIIFPNRDYKKTCYLEDSKATTFKTTLTRLAGRTCVGVSCGYAILFGKRFRDFWLVNPITRHKLHFPNVSFRASCLDVRTILVYSPSFSAPVFLVVNLFEREIWFSIAGKGTWNTVSSMSEFVDLHAFKGKIYTLNTNKGRWGSFELGHICELTFDPESHEPKLTTLQTKISLKPARKWEFVSSGEKLYVVQLISEQKCKIHELDIGKMELVTSSKKATSENVFFLSYIKSSAAVNPLFSDVDWAGKFANMYPRSPRRNVWVNIENMWYFPHDCFNANRLEV